MIENPPFFLFPCVNDSHEMIWRDSLLWHDDCTFDRSMWEQKMINRMPMFFITAGIVAAAACSMVNDPTTAHGVQQQRQTIIRESMIVQAVDMGTAAAAVRSVGGEITHKLAIIRGVGALLTPSQVAALEKTEGITLSENRQVEASKSAGVVGGAWLDIGKKQVRWKLTNNGKKDVRIRFQPRPGRSAPGERPSRHRPRR